MIWSEITSCYKFHLLIFVFPFKNLFIMQTLKIMRGRPKKETTEPIKSDYLNVTELSEYLKMSTSHIYSLTSRKEIPHIKVLGKKLLFEKSEILNWLKSKKVSAK